MKDLQSLELQAFYSLFFNRHNEILNNKIVPFLISVPTDYHDYLFTVMLFSGTRSDDWAQEIRSNLNINNLISLHGYYMENRMANASYYWNYYHNLVCRSEETLSKDAICWVPNSLYKFSYRGKVFKDEATYNKAMLKSELKILDPDLIVIMSNPNNIKSSQIIQEAFGEYESVSTRIDRVYRLEFKDSEIPCLRVDSAAYQEVTQSIQQIQDYIMTFVCEQLKIRYSLSCTDTERKHD